MIEKQHCWSPMHSSICCKFLSICCKFLCICCKFLSICKFLCICCKFLSICCKILYVCCEFVPISCEFLSFYLYLPSHPVSPLIGIIRWWPRSIIVSVGTSEAWGNSAKFGSFSLFISPANYLYSSPWQLSTL